MRSSLQPGTPVERALAPAPSGPSEERVGTWEPVARTLPAVRRFTLDAIRVWGLGGLADAAALVVTELATNAVEHAGTPFTVTLTRMPDGLLIRVADGLRVFPMAVGPVSTDDDGGRGLLLVSALAVGWGTTVEDGGGKAVWALVSVGVDTAATQAVTASYEREVGARAAETA